MNKEIEENIEKAKKLAKEDYEKSMKKIKAYNPEVKREWREVKLDDGRLAFALEGTPDKAFVVVEKDYSVTARRGDNSIIETFRSN